ncbi:MAG TPA: hypothetical protein VGK00_06165 [Anaerolineales bacterium]|jgi:hypothetical protein
MKQKTRIKAIQKAALSRTNTGQPVTEIVIYGTDEDGKTRLLDDIILENKERPGARVYLPDNGRGEQ